MSDQQKLELALRFIKEQVRQEMGFSERLSIFADIREIAASAGVQPEELNELLKPIVKEVTDEMVYGRKMAVLLQPSSWP